jgi:hypothetical protein
MKRNIYISFIHDEAKNFKFKMVENHKGRKYKFSNELFDLTSTTFEQDKDAVELLAKNISRTDVTVVLITKSILECNWIPLEVKLSLDLTEHLPNHTKPKGIIGVVIPEKGNDYSYIMKKGLKGLWYADKEKLPEIISANMHNEIKVQNKYNKNFDSYISVYRWDNFVSDFDNCINIAYDKANKHFEDYEITY